MGRSAFDNLSSAHSEIVEWQKTLDNFTLMLDEIIECWRVIRQFEPAALFYFVFRNFYDDVDETVDHLLSN
jgi:hypothetical protein